jgi:hypothetical protein
MGFDNADRITVSYNELRAVISAYLKQKKIGPTIILFNDDIEELCEYIFNEV